MAIRPQATTATMATMSTTTAALVSAGTAVIFVSRNLLKKAAGKGWHGENDCCAIEVSLALKHAEHVVVVLTDESVHEVVGWPGKTGEKLAKLARGPRPAIDIVNDGASAATIVPSDRPGQLCLAQDLVAGVYSIVA